VATALELGGPAGLALARASGGDLDRARELLQGGEASDRRERYLALARSAYADDRFDPGAAARAVAEACTARGAEARGAAEAEAARRVEALGDHPPRAEASRVRREGEALAKRRARAAEVDEARAAVETLVAWYRDLLAATLGADDTLVHSDHREQVTTDAASGREALAARCLEAARDTRRALELTITPTLALEALFHRLRTIARAEQANA
ncbi:MAG: polymerase delta subunit, terminal, partial [Gaiellales bacterium]|nr:polymerase delta subunit, terminal [Gaiellales bacterium]